MIQDWLARGGPMMWPIVGVSVLGMAIILERAFFWLRYWWNRDLRRRRDLYLGRIVPNEEDAQGGDLVARVACWTLWSPARGRLLADRLLAAGRRGVGALELLASVSTTLGLFGTVVGVSLSFRSISSGETGDVVYGLGVALFTTVFGLVVHLYLGIIAAFWRFLQEKLETEVERALSARPAEFQEEGVAQ